MSDLYVVVNVSRPAEHARVDGEFSVMPGESPRTYPSLEAAAECLVRLAIEFGHNADSAPVYKLVPVPDEDVVPAFERALAELEGEREEMFDDD